MMSPPQDHHFPGGGGGGSVGTHLKDTELSLTLALPGSSSDTNPNTTNNKLTLDLLPPSKAGAKRGFSDAIDNFNNAAGGASASPAAAASSSASKPSSKDNKAPSKAQVVGWPPIRSYRKNTMATSTTTTTTPLKTKDEASSAAAAALPEQNSGGGGGGCLYVKVSMDGAPYLRKVDLKLYGGYKELSVALEKMFGGFTSGGGKDEAFTESRTKDLLNKSEYVLTYEDKDGDWMLVGDVPWVMFVESCKKLKIMKGSDAIGLAPRAKNQS